MSKLIKFNKDIYVPKDAEFRPYYFSLIVSSIGKYHNTVFIHPVFSEPEDDSNIHNVLLPHLQRLNDVTACGWEVKINTMNGMKGILVSGRLAWYLLRALTKIDMPPEWNLLYVDELEV